MTDDLSRAEHSDHAAHVNLIGVRFDGYGRLTNQTTAAAALRRAGIARDLPSTLTDLGDVAPPEQSAQRGPNGLINEHALTYVKRELARQVEASIRADHFPLVIGGDCAALLGSLSGACRALGDCGLLHIDGHEDTTPIDASEDGEAANSEIGILLGLVGRNMRGELTDDAPLLDRSALALLGQRDDEWRRDLNVGSLADLGVWKRDWKMIAEAPAESGCVAATYVQRAATGWWLHVDVDVLDPAEFPAQGLPEFPDEPGGLTKNQLTILVETASAQGGCIGASIAIYDPDQDPDATGAHYVVQLAHRLIGARSTTRR